MPHKSGNGGLERKTRKFVQEFERVEELLLKRSEKK